MTHYKVTRPNDGRDAQGFLGPMTRPWLIADGSRVVIWCATREEARAWVRTFHEVGEGCLEKLT